MLPDDKLYLLQEITSQRWKLRIFLFNVSCCLAAAYFFRRHNKFCEAGGEHDEPKVISAEFMC